MVLDCLVTEEMKERTNQRGPAKEQINHQNPICQAPTSPVNSVPSAGMAGSLFKLRPTVQPFYQYSTVGAPGKCTVDVVPVLPSNAHIIVKCRYENIPIASLIQFLDVLCTHADAQTCSALYDMRIM